MDVLFFFFGGGRSQAVFELLSKQVRTSPILSEYTTDSEPVLIINRSYSPDGRNKTKINGFTVTVSQLKEIGNCLVDLHGPHDHQMLFSEDSHIDIIDRLSDLHKVKDDYGKVRN